MMGRQPTAGQAGLNRAMPHRDDFSILMTILIGLVVLLIILALDGSGGDKS